MGLEGAFGCFRHSCPAGARENLVFIALEPLGSRKCRSGVLGAASALESAARACSRAAQAFEKHQIRCTSVSFASFSSKSVALASHCLKSDAWAHKCVARACLALPGRSKMPLGHTPSGSWSCQECARAAFSRPYVAPSTPERQLRVPRRQISSNSNKSDTCAADFEPNLANATPVQQISI